MGLLEEQSKKIFCLNSDPIAIESIFFLAAPTTEGVNGPVGPALMRERFFVLYQGDEGLLTVRGKSADLAILSRPHLGNRPANALKAIESQAFYGSSQNWRKDLLE